MFGGVPSERQQKPALTVNTAELPPREKRPTFALRRFTNFYPLILPTIVSVLLVISTTRGWTQSYSYYGFVNRHRAPIQFVVQVIAYILGSIQILAICQLINYITRMHFAQNSVKLDVLRLWNALCSRSMVWGLPFKLRLVLICFLLGSLAPAALWAGAITPIEALKWVNSTTAVPNFSDVLSIKDYSLQPQLKVPTLNNDEGLFTYAPAAHLRGQLLSSAEAIRGVGVQSHPKPDNTGYTYVGRSYGVGASVGLDSSNPWPELTDSYTFQETGYEASITCIYNRTSTFEVKPTKDAHVFDATGAVPNSNGVPISTLHLANSSSSIVAIGVTPTRFTSTRVLSIAAGEGYKSLNQAQCTINFIPTLFSILVNPTGKNITVSKLSINGIADIDTTGNLTFAATRQLALLSSLETGVSSSPLGDAIQFSIETYRQILADTSDPLPPDDIVLSGLRNVVASLLDNILLSYGSAQLLISSSSTPTPSILSLHALRFGHDGFIYAVLAVNLLILLAVIIEALRTRMWRRVPAFDFTDPRRLVVGGSLGGSKIAYQAAKAGDDRHIGELEVGLSKTGNCAVVYCGR